MSYIGPPFIHDLFVSYSHGDDGTGQSYLKPWSAGFAKELEHDRQSARARANRLLPCGLLDTVGAPIATPVRQATARIVQADWLDATHDPWTPEVRNWLMAKGAQVEPLP